MYTHTHRNRCMLRTIHTVHFTYTITEYINTHIHTHTHTPKTPTHQHTYTSAASETHREHKHTHVHTHTHTHTHTQSSEKYELRLGMTVWRSKVFIQYWPKLDEQTKVLLSTSSFSLILFL